MRRVKLPTGAEVVVGCRHDVFTPGGGPHRRYTEAWVKDAATGELIAEDRAVCHERDNFCRRVGRRLAAIRVLAKLRLLGAKNYKLHDPLHWASHKANRRTVFLAVCPEYRSE